MPLKHIRIERLRQLQAERKIPGPVEFGKLIGRKANQVSDLLSGRASFGEKVARSIEAAARLPDGWLDQTTNDEGASKVERAAFEPQQPATIGDASDKLTTADLELLENFNALPDEDQIELRAEIEQRAAKAKAYIAKVFRTMDLPEANLPNTLRSPTPAVSPQGTQGKEVYATQLNNKAGMGPGRRAAQLGATGDASRNPATNKRGPQRSGGGSSS